jgi:hypothetical protein
MWPKFFYNISFGELEKKLKKKRILGYNIFFLYFIFVFWHNFSLKKKALYLHVFLYNAQQSLIFQAKAKFLEKRRRRELRFAERSIKTCPGFLECGLLYQSGSGQLRRKHGPVGQWAAAIGGVRDPKPALTGSGQLLFVGSGRKNMQQLGSGQLVPST